MTGKSKKAAEILIPYVEAHLGEVTREITNCQDEINLLRMHPDRSDCEDIPGRILFLTKLVEQLLRYVEQVLNDIERAKS